MSLTLECFDEACVLAGIKSKFVDDNRSVLLFELGSRKRVAVNTNLGLLTDAEWRLFRDKYYSYLVFQSTKLMPPTWVYIDPKAEKQYAPYVIWRKNSEIEADIKKNLHLPIIIKRNSGTRGRNVFLCRREAEIGAALKKIYAKTQSEYDHVALAQTYIQPKAEYRLVVLASKLEFAYVKPHHKAVFGGTIQPQLIRSKSLLRKLRVLVERLVSVYPLLYAGVDVVADKGGNLWVIEINGSPVYSSLIRTYGKQPVIELFTRVIGYFDKQ